MSAAASPHATRGATASQSGLPPRKRALRGTASAQVDEEDDGAASEEAPAAAADKQASQGTILEEIDEEGEDEAAEDEARASAEAGRLSIAILLAKQQQGEPISEVQRRHVNNAFQRAIESAADLDDDMVRCIMDWYEFNKERLHLNWHPSEINSAGLASVVNKESMICIYFASQIMGAGRHVPVRDSFAYKRHLCIAHIACVRACARVLSIFAALTWNPVAPAGCLPLLHRCVLR